jgi:PPOX class probable F420-dependent enzyme
MSAPTLTASASMLEPLERRWAVLLRTRKRDGTWVGTPVNLAVDGERAYFGTPDDSWKVKRLRNFDEVKVAPSTLRGQPTGPALSARARLLEGDEARAAERLLVRRHPIVHRFVVPLELGLKGTTNKLCELTDFRPLDD